MEYVIKKNYGILGILKSFNKEKGFGFVSVPMGYGTDYVNCFFHVKQLSQIYREKVLESLNSWDSKTELCFAVSDTTKTEKGWTTKLLWVENPKTVFVVTPDISKMLRLTTAKSVVKSGSESIFATDTYTKTIQIVEVNGTTYKDCESRIGNVESGIATLKSKEKVEKFYDLFAINVNNEFVEIELLSSKYTLIDSVCTKETEFSSVVVVDIRTTEDGEEVIYGME
jgi:hypothetical protein